MDAVKFIMIAILCGCIARGLWTFAMIVRQIHKDREKE